MDDPQRTGYRAGVRRFALPRRLLFATATVAVALGAAGFVLGRSLGTERTPATAPLTTTPASTAAEDPIVIPEPLDIPDA